MCCVLVLNLWFSVIGVLICDGKWKVQLSLVLLHLKDGWKWYVGKKTQTAHCRESLGNVSSKLCGRLRVLSLPECK